MIPPRKLPIFNQILLGKINNLENSSVVSKKINPIRDILIILNGENLSSKKPPNIDPNAADILIIMAKYRISILYASCK